MDLSRFPRVGLCHSPTPFEPMKKLSEVLGGPNLYIKRDDCTGLATGGNKTRKLEYLMAEALEQGADTVITLGATQSNHARQTAAAAAKIGLKCELVLECRVTDPDPDYEFSGNILLDNLLGCTIHNYPMGTDKEAGGLELAKTIEKNGGKPYFVPVGGSNRTGALGYVRCAEELLGQARQADLMIDSVVHATGSGGTQAGLVTGLRGLGCAAEVRGVSVGKPRDEMENDAYRLACETAEAVGCKGGVDQGDIIVDDGYVGPGYSVPTEEMVEAVSLTAKHEGILLDPVYTGKAMAGLIGMIRAGAFTKDQNVVFLHTGGLAGLFAYRRLFSPDG